MKQQKNTVKKDEVAPEQSLRDRLVANFKARTEQGASTLGPMVIIGMMIVVIAASIASATSFAAKISFVQVEKMNQNMEEKSILNSFIAAAYSGAGFSTENIVENAGTYSLYYSTAEEQPNSIDDLNLEPLSGAIPTTARWVLVDMEVESKKEGVNPKRTAVYASSSIGDPVLDSAINWKGSATLQDTAVRSAVGVQSPNYISLSESTADSQNSLRIDSSDLRAKVFANYTTPIEVNSGKVTGDISSESSIYFTDNTEVRGDVYSNNQVGEANIWGQVSANYYNRPQPNEQATEQLEPLDQVFALTAETCKNSDSLKTLLESFDRPTTVTGAENCENGSWSTDIEPNTDILIESNSDLLVKDLNVVGSNGSLGFASYGNLELESVNYKNGAYGQFLSSRDLTVEKSQLSGVISSFNTAGGQLNTKDSVLEYRPVTSPLAGNCGESSCGVTSNSIHLLKVG